MKILRTAAALAFLLVCVPAFAQQTAIHSVPIGKGVGNTGFNAAVPSTAGQPLVSTGPTTDPAFGTIANSGFTAGAANTAKGSLNGTTVTDLPLPSCTGVNQALKYTSGVGFNCSVVSTTGGFDMPINLGLSASASGNALTLTLTQANGSAPNSSNPVLVPFRSTTATIGTITWSTISATQSITVPSGATLGTSSGNIAFRIWIFLDYDSGTPQLGVATCSASGTLFPCAAWESTLQTSSVISGSSNNAGQLYASVNVSADAVRIIGFCEYGSGLTTAGSWASACTTLQAFGPGIKKPGDVVQEVNVAGGSTGTPTQAIIPSSAANIVKFTGMYNCTLSVSSSASANFVFRRASTTLDTLALGGTANAEGMNVVGSDVLFDSPNTTSSVTYSILNSGATCTGVVTSHISLEEIQG